LEALKFWGLLLVSIAAVVVAVLGWLNSRRSASAAERSADQAKRSADAAEAAHRLQVRPHVIALVEVRKQVVGPTVRSRSELVVVNRGLGTAAKVHARLRITHSGGETELPAITCPDLGHRDEHVVPGMPQAGRVDVWGAITFEDMDRKAYRLKRSQGQEEWREVDA